MKSTFRFQVRNMSFFRRIEGAEASSSAINTELCNPFATVLTKMYAKKAGFVCNASSPFVLHIGAARYITKICNAVVVFVAIDMVKLTLRPLSMAVKPRKPVRSVTLGINHEVPVADFIEPSRARICALDDASKKPGIWAVVEQLLKSDGGNDWFHRVFKPNSGHVARPRMLALI